MRVDAHQHYWRYSAKRYSWIDAGMEILARDWLPQDFAQLRRQQQIDATIAVQACGEETETKFLMALAAEAPWIAGVVGWINLRAENVGEQLSYWQGRGPLVGLRHQVQDERDPFAYLDDVAFSRGVAEVQNAGLAYDLLLRGPQLDAATAFCRRHDRAPLLLDHLGKPNIAAGEVAFARWKAAITPLAQLPHVAIKLSGLVTEAVDAAGRVDEAAIVRYLDTTLNLFGTQRMLFGSDWPVCLQVSAYADVYRIVSDWSAKLSADERTALFGGNALIFYGKGLRLE